MIIVSVVARVATDNTGALSEIPALLTSGGVLQTPLDYCLQKQLHRSRSWMKNLLQAVALFIEYLNIHPDAPMDYRLFRDFATRLYTGTFDRQSGFDPSNLCWRARGWDVAGRYITLLSDFFEWLAEIQPGATAINPRYAGNAFDERLDQLAYLYRRESAFLGHTWDASTTSAGQQLTRPRHPPRAVGGEPPAFPESRFEELLFRGFKVGPRHDYRGILLTILMHGCGFRMSEPFHMFLDDVGHDPSAANSALVRIHHPSMGGIPSGWVDKSGATRKDNRAVYLAEMFALTPRDQVLGSKHAGWKHPLLDEKWFMQGYWFEPKYGDWFMQIWPYYLKDVACLERNHPYAWVNTERDPHGGIYTIPMFEKAHRRACERIGLQVTKKLGTTPHGHRHAYGQRLKRAGFSTLLKMRLMHHASPESQKIYTQPSQREVREALSAAIDNLNDAHRVVVPPSVLLRSEWSH